MSLKGANQYRQTVALLTRSLKKREVINVQYAHNPLRGNHQAAPAFKHYPLSPVAMPDAVFSKQLLRCKYIFIWRKDINSVTRHAASRSSQHTG